MTTEEAFPIAAFTFVGGPGSEMGVAVPAREPAVPVPIALMAATLTE